MSPEQAAGGGVDARSDLYSLGCVLYEILAGERLVDRPLTPGDKGLGPEVPAGLDAALRKALAQSPSDRYPTAGEFGQALDAALEDAPLGRKARRFAIGSRGLSLTVLVLLLALGYGASHAWTLRHPDPPVLPDADAAHPTWIAVLPMADAGGDASEAYFADGMTDAIRENSPGCAVLEVVAPASSNEYRRSSKSLQQVGQELGVRYVLNGSIRRTRGSSDGGRIQVSPQLVDVATGAIKWRQHFDAPPTEIFRVQSEISGAVARELDVALGAKERGLLAARPPGASPPTTRF